MARQPATRNPTPRGRLPGQFNRQLPTDYDPPYSAANLDIDYDNGTPAVETEVDDGSSDCEGISTKYDADKEDITEVDMLFDRATSEQGLSGISVKSLETMKAGVAEVAGPLAHELARYFHYGYDDGVEDIKKGDVCWVSLVERRKDSKLTEADFHVSSSYGGPVLDKARPALKFAGLGGMIIFLTFHLYGVKEVFFNGQLKPHIVEKLKDRTFVQVLTEGEAEIKVEGALDALHVTGDELKGPCFLQLIPVPAQVVAPVKLMKKTRIVRRDTPLLTKYMGKMWFRMLDEYLLAEGFSNEQSEANAQAEAIELSFEPYGPNAVKTTSVATEQHAQLNRTYSQTFRSVEDVPGRSFRYYGDLSGPASTPEGDGYYDAAGNDDDAQHLKGATAAPASNNHTRSTTNISIGSIDNTGVGAMTGLINNNIGAPSTVGLQTKPDLFPNGPSSKAKKSTGAGEFGKLASINKPLPPDNDDELSTTKKGPTQSVKNIDKMGKFGLESSSGARVATEQVLKRKAEEAESKNPFFKVVEKKVKGFKDALTGKSKSGGDAKGED